MYCVDTLFIESIPTLLSIFQFDALVTSSLEGQAMIVTRTLQLPHHSVVGVLLL